MPRSHSQNFAKSFNLNLPLKKMFVTWEIQTSYLNNCAPVLRSSNQIQFVCIVDASHNLVGEEDALSHMFANGTMGISVLLIVSRVRHSNGKTEDSIHSLPTDTEAHPTLSPQLLESGIHRGSA